MKKYIYIISAAILAISSCGKENTTVSPDDKVAEKQTVTISARISDATKATLTIDGSKGKCAWAADDAIAVWTGSKFVTFAIDPTTVGSATAKFTAELEAGQTPSDYAIYPASIASGMNSSGYPNVNLPTSSVWVSDSDVKPYMISEIPATWDGTLDFNHMGGMLRFTISNMPSDARSISITAYDESNTERPWAKIGSSYTVSEPDGDPILAGYGLIPATTSAGKEPSISFSTPASTMVFNIPVPVYAYKQLTINVKDGDGKVLCYKTSTKTQNVTRGALVNMPVLDATAMVVPAPTTDCFVKQVSALSTSVTVQFGVTSDYTVATDITKDYNVTLYSNAACTTPVYSYDFKSTGTAGGSTGTFLAFDASNFPPVFTFAGLAPGTSYWCIAQDITDPANPKPSEAVEVTTNAFTRVDIGSLSAGSAVAGQVILAENFSDIKRGGYWLNGIKSIGLKNTTTTGNITSDYPATFLSSKSGYPTISDETLVGYNAYVGADTGKGICSSDNISGLSLNGWHMMVQKTDGTIYYETKTNMYPHLGYFHIGNFSGSSNSRRGMLITPKLAPLSGTATIEVSFDAQNFSSSNSVAVVAAPLTSITAGAFNFVIQAVTPNTAEALNAYSTTVSGTTMKTYTITIPGVTADNYIAIGHKYAQSGVTTDQRFDITNIKIKVVSYQSASPTIAHVENFNVK